MKTTLTITIDADVKQKAMAIIENKFNSNISAEINQLLKKIVEKEAKNELL